MSLITSKTLSSFCIILFPLSVYLLTLCPTVYVGDSGELSAAAFCLGVPHASGYPLYALLGKIFCLIPFGSVGFRMNLMSAVFGVLAVWTVYSLIQRMSGSRVGAWAGAGVLAFIPVFWWQTVAAEVYAPHVFFVALMIWLLWEWEVRREFSILLLFALVTGLSFGNHLQTVMLAPGVFYLILSADRRVLWDGKRCLALCLFFLLPLLVYLYLPIRTWAGTAIHWGDPDTWDRFWAHVSGQSHRGVYVFNLGMGEYSDRLKESLAVIWNQFGVITLAGVWGWWKLRVVRWKIFFLAVAGFDLFYTVFLNTISLQITPFNLSVSLVLAIGTGVGVGRMSQALKAVRGIREGVQKAVEGACCVLPIIPLLLNFSLCDQSRNYTAYEQGLNTFRTPPPGATLFVEGDNAIFPVAYCRLAERMREDLVLYDRQAVIFKMPGLRRLEDAPEGQWYQERLWREQEIIRHRPKGSVFYALFDPASASGVRDQVLVPHGILHHFVGRDSLGNASLSTESVWSSYAEESFYDSFERDYMTRQVCAFFLLKKGSHLVNAGSKTLGLTHILRASRIAYDDSGVHSMAAILFIEHGFFEEAREALEKASTDLRRPGVSHNNWGLYYYRTGNLPKAIEAFREAVKCQTDHPLYHRNLGLALLKSGAREEAAVYFRNSLIISPNQEDLVDFMREQGLDPGNQEPKQNKPQGKESKGAGSTETKT
jgi:tetratricopeptide (TPR) repeat protein